MIQLVNRLHGDNIAIMRMFLACFYYLVSNFFYVKSPLKFFKFSFDVFVNFLPKSLQILLRIYNKIRIIFEKKIVFDISS